MSFVLSILTVLVGVVALLAAIGMALPRVITVARSIKITAPAAEIFPHVNNLRATVPWSPWLARDPDAALDFNDIPEGVGAAMTWASENRSVGSGRMEITGAEPPVHLDVALDFGAGSTAEATWDFAEAGGVTRATWRLTIDMGGGPHARWMGMMMDRWVGRDYEEGLANLKALVEG